MKEQPLVSVVMPTFNRAHTIKTTIESVLAQTYPNWELLIIDDGSTDDTEKVVSTVQDKRIHYHRKINGGPAEARNYGICKAHGKWICYLDSDDTIFPNCTETMLSWLAKNPRAVYAFPRSTRILELYEDGKLVKSVDDSIDTPPDFSAEDLYDRKAGLSPNGFMHLCKLYNEGLRWDKNCPLMEDWEFMLSIGAKYPDGFLYVPVVLQRYTQRFGSDNLVSAAQYSDWADAFEYIYQKHKNDKILKHQTWYPEKVTKWLRRQEEYDAGKRPAYKYHHFIDA